MQALSGECKELSTVDQVVPEPGELVALKDCTQQATDEGTTTSEKVQSALPSPSGVVVNFCLGSAEHLPPHPFLPFPPLPLPLSFPLSNPFLSLHNTLFPAFPFLPLPPPWKWYEQFLRSVWLSNPDSDWRWNHFPHHHVKFCRNSSIHSTDIAIFQFFKMAATAILNFRNRNILLANRICRDETHHSAKFCLNWSNRR